MIGIATLLWPLRPITIRARDIVPNEAFPSEFTFRAEDEGLYRSLQDHGSIRLFRIESPGLVRAWEFRAYVSNIEGGRVTVGLA